MEYSTQSLKNGSSERSSGSSGSRTSSDKALRSESSRSAINEQKEQRGGASSPNSDNATQRQSRDDEGLFSAFREGGTVKSFMESFNQVGEELKTRFEELSGRTKEWTGTLSETMKSNPMYALAIACGAGFLLGTYLKSGKKQ